MFMALGERNRHKDGQNGEPKEEEGRDVQLRLAVLPVSRNVDELLHK